MRNIEPCLKKQRICPSCGSDKTIKRGYQSGRQRYQCNTCHTLFQNKECHTEPFKKTNKNPELLLSETEKTFLDKKYLVEACPKNFEPIPDYQHLLEKSISIAYSVLIKTKRDPKGVCALGALFFFIEHYCI